MKSKRMLPYLVSFVLLLSLSCFAKTHVLNNLTDTVVNIIRGSTLPHQPGDTILIPQGTYAGLRFVDFRGDSANPIRIQNQGGLVRIRAPKYHGIQFQNSKHIHLTGTGVPSIYYGISVDTVVSGGVGVAIGSLSSDVEVDHLEVQHTGFAGMMAKTDPDCADTMTWRSNGFVMRNIHIHHNYIHDTHGEGIYIGYTGGYLVNSKKVCNGVPVFAHWLENVEVNHNFFERTGWDGIQVNLVRSNGSIHHNIVRNYGLARETYQNFGMSVGGGHYSIHANHVSNDPEWGPNSESGIQLISAMSGSSLTHNVFSYTGGYGIFIHNRNAFDQPNVGYTVNHNTVAYSTKSAIFYNAGITESFDSTLLGNTQLTTPYVAKNNLLISPVVDYTQQNFWKKNAESFLDFNDKAQRDAHVANLQGNVMTRQEDTLGLEDPLLSQFKIVDANSPLVDAGVAVTIGQGFADLLGIPLYQGSPDVGAYEFSASITPILKGRLLPKNYGFQRDYDLLGRLK